MPKSHRKEPLANLKGTRFLKALKDAEMDIPEMAEVLDMSYTSVQNWADRGVPAHQSFTVGRVLNKNPEWLCDESCNYETLSTADMANQYREIIEALTPDELAKVVDFVVALRG